MTRRWWLWVLVLLVGVAAHADTLYLTNGRQLPGELCGVTAGSVQWCAISGVQASFPLTDVVRVEFGADPTLVPRVTEAEWRRAMGSAQRQLTSCRSARTGLILGGLVFIGGGYWLGLEGHTAGNFIMAIGTVAAGLGVIAPNPRCPVQEDRARVLARIGLDHGWMY